VSKLAFVLPNWATIGKDDLIYYSGLAEDLGYDSIWVPETWGNDAFTLLTSIALNTTKLKIGTGIVSIYSRSPANIAQTISTIDSFSGGRAMLGLGASTDAVNENWHGVKHKKPLRRTREYVEIIRLILSGERVNYDGEIFKLKNLKLQSKPIRRDIPIFLATLGPKNLELTGKIADGWLPFLCPEKHILKLRHKVEKAALDSGRIMNDIAIYPYVPALISKDTDRANYLIKEFISFYVGAMGPHYNKLISSYGFEDDAIRIREAWNSKDMESCINGVSDDLLDLVSINGSRESAERKLKSYLDISTCPIIMFPFKATKEQITETLEALAPSKG